MVIPNKNINDILNILKLDYQKGGIPSYKVVQILNKLFNDNYIIIKNILEKGD